MSKAGKLTIAVRVFDRNGEGGFYGPAASMILGLANADRQHADLVGGDLEIQSRKSVAAI